MAVAPQVAPLPNKPHAPSRTLLRRLLGPLHVTGIFWYRAAWFCSWFPKWVGTIVIHVCTWITWLCLWNIRAAIASNLEAVLGPCGWFERQRRIWRTLHQFSCCYCERYEQFRPGVKMRFDFVGEKTYEKMRATDRGFVFFTAHFGNWEMGPLTEELPGNRKFHIVREPEMSVSAQHFVEELFDKHPQRDQFVVHYAGGDLALGAKLLMALRKGDVVGMPGDRPRAGMATLKSSMFDRPMELPPGPAALARAANAPMVPVFVFREGRRHYRIELWEPIEVGSGEDKEADIQKAVDAMGQACERAIRQRPHHWFCWARLWPR